MLFPKSLTSIWTASDYGNADSISSSKIQWLKSLSTFLPRHTDLARGAGGGVGHLTSSRLLSPDSRTCTAMCQLTSILSIGKDSETKQ